MRLRLLLTILVLMLIAAGVVWWRWGKYVMMEAQRQRAMELMMKGGIPLEQMPKPLGNPDAKVVMEVVAPPFACHNPQLIQTAQEIAEKYKDKVYVKFTASPPAGAVTCLGIVINGKQKFQIKERTVELHGPLMTSSVGAKYGYTKDDIESAIQQEIERVYKNK